MVCITEVIHVCVNAEYELDDGIPRGVRVIHRFMKSGSGFASARDLLLFQDHFRTDDGCYVIYEISVNGETPTSATTAVKNAYVRAEVLLCAYMLIPSGRDVRFFDRDKV